MRRADCIGFGEWVYMTGQWRHVGGVERVEMAGMQMLRYTFSDYQIPTAVITTSGSLYETKQFHFNMRNSDE